MTELGAIYHHQLFRKPIFSETEVKNSKNVERLKPAKNVSEYVRKEARPQATGKGMSTILAPYILERTQNLGQQKAFRSLTHIRQHIYSYGFALSELYKQDALPYSKYKQTVNLLIY